jgi:hypothetical protein
MIEIYSIVRKKNDDTLSINYTALRSLSVLNARLSDVLPQSATTVNKQYVRETVTVSSGKLTVDQQAR